MWLFNGQVETHTSAQFTAIDTNTHPQLECPVQCDLNMPHCPTTTRCHSCHSITATVASSFGWSAGMRQHVPLVQCVLQMVNARHPSTRTTARSASKSLYCCSYWMCGDDCRPNWWHAVACLWCCLNTFIESQHNVQPGTCTEPEICNAVPRLYQ